MVRGNSLFDKALRLTAVVLAAVILFGVGIMSSRATERSEDSLRILCLGIEHNAANTARFDPEIVELCAGVGVQPVP